MIFGKDFISPMKLMQQSVIDFKKDARVLECGDQALISKLNYQGNQDNKVVCSTSGSSRFPLSPPK